MAIEDFNKIVHGHAKHADKVAKQATEARYKEFDTNMSMSYKDDLLALKRMCGSMQRFIDKELERLTKGE